MIAPQLVALVERGLNSGPLTHSIYSAQTANAVRIVATLCASISMLCGILAFYWFTRMKRKFRHTWVSNAIYSPLCFRLTSISLIMTMILSDLFKDINYIAFSIISFSRGGVSSSSAYCQASGFMIQFGVEVTGTNVTDCH